MNASVMDGVTAHRPLRVVALGGGTGLPAVLSGLAAHPEVSLTAVVAMSDDGGSSGRLRRWQGLPPPGDVRNCLVALAGEGQPLGRLFQYRFRGSGALRGHALGNLVIAGATERTGDFLAAVEVAGNWLGTRGRVLPCTLEPVQLVAQREGALPVRGQRWLARGRGRVRRVWLDPPGVAPAPGVLRALEAADVIVLGPGSLYSSVLPPLLVEGVAESIQSSRALRVWVGNLVTQRGETEGMDAAAHVRAVVAHAGAVVDVALLHGDPLPAELEARYARRGVGGLLAHRRSLRAECVVPHFRELLAPGLRARHDPRRLAEAVLELAAGWGGRGACGEGGQG